MAKILEGEKGTGQAEGLDMRYFWHPVSEKRKKENDPVAIFQLVYEDGYIEVTEERKAEAEEKA